MARYMANHSFPNMLYVVSASLIFLEGSRLPAGDVLGASCAFRDDESLSLETEVRAQRGKTVNDRIWRFLLR